MTGRYPTRCFLEQIFEFSRILATSYFEVYQNFNQILKTASTAAEAAQHTVTMFKKPDTDKYVAAPVLEPVYTLTRTYAMIAFRILCEFTDCNMREIITDIMKQDKLLMEVCDLN